MQSNTSYLSVFVTTSGFEKDLLELEREREVEREPELDLELEFREPLPHQPSHCPSSFTKFACVLLGLYTLY